MGRGRQQGSTVALCAVCLFLLAAGTQARRTTLAAAAPGTTQGTTTAATRAGSPEPLPPNTTTGISPTGVPFTYAPDVLNAGNPIPDPNPSSLGIVRPLGAYVVLSTAPKASLRGGAVALAAAAASGQFPAGTGPSPKPVDANNDDDDLAQLPWATIGKLSLNGGATFCTATLIHPQYVLTTGSCLYNMRYNSTLDDGCCASDPTSDCCSSTQPFLPIDGFSLQMNARADGKGSVKQPFGRVGVSLIRWKGPEAPYMAENIVGNAYLGTVTDYALLQLDKALPGPVMPMDWECTGRYSLTIAGYGLGQNPEPHNATMYRTTCDVVDLDCYSDYNIPLDTCNLGKLGFSGAPVLIKKQQPNGSSSWAMRGMVRSWCDTDTGKCSKEAFELSPQDIDGLNVRVATAPLNAGTFLCPT